MFEFFSSGAVGLSDPFGNGKGEPVPHVRHQTGPFPVFLRLSRPAGAETVQNFFDFQEFFLIIKVVTAGKAAVGAFFQLLPEFFDFHVQRFHAFDFDIMTLIVVDIIEGMVDFLDFLPDPVPGGEKLGLENGHILDGIFPETLLEFRKQPGQVVFLDTAEDFLVFIAVGPVHVGGKVRVRLVVKSQVLQVMGHAFGHFSR